MSSFEGQKSFYRSFESFFGELHIGVPTRTPRNVSKFLGEASSWAFQAMYYSKKKKSKIEKKLLRTCTLFSSSRSPLSIKNNFFKTNTKYWKIFLPPWKLSLSSPKDKGKRLFFWSSFVTMNLKQKCNGNCSLLFHQVRYFFSVFLLCFFAFFANKKKTFFLKQRQIKENRKRENCSLDCFLF